MKKKNTAVIGAGWFGKAHIRNFYNLSNLVGVCDVNKVKLKEISDMYSDINTYNNTSDLINSESIDAVSIVTPPKNIPNLARTFAEKDTFNH